MYPTIEEVEQADRVQLARWYRFLPSPGWAAANSGDREAFERELAYEKPIMDRIVARF